MHTDIATDPESRGKGKCRKKHIYKYGFDTDIKDDHILKQKIPKRTLCKERVQLSIPKPPKELMQSQCTTSRKEKDTVIAKPCFSSKEQLTQIAKKTVSIATHESGETNKHSFTSKLYKCKMQAERIACSTITLPLTSMKENTSLSISKSHDLYDKHEKSASVVKPFSESEELHKKYTNVPSTISKHESRKESNKVSHTTKSSVYQLTSTETDNRFSRSYNYGKKKQCASSVIGSPTSLPNDENAFTPRSNRLMKNDKNIFSTVNPLSELIDENTVVTFRQSHTLSSQSNTKPASTNESFSNEILESVKDIYGANATVSNNNNVGYNNDNDICK